MMTEKTIVLKEPDRFEIETVTTGIFEGERYAPALFYSPGATTYSDGSQSFSLRFPVLVSTPMLSDKEKVLAKIADVLNAHFAAPPAKEG